jgi:ribosome biogenesis protein SSF1/2
MCIKQVGRVSPVVGELVRDLRKLMGPYTADKLREKNYNRMKDYAGVAGHIGVTHLLIVSQVRKLCINVY